MSLYLVLFPADNYIHSMKDYRKFEKLFENYCVLKIQMVFNLEEELSENLIKKWQQMDNSFTLLFLYLNTSAQKEILN